MRKNDTGRKIGIGSIANIIEVLVGAMSNLPVKTVRRDGRDRKSHFYVDVFEASGCVRFGVGYAKVQVRDRTVLATVHVEKVTNAALIIKFECAFV